MLSSLPPTARATPREFLTVGGPSAFQLWTSAHEERCLVRCPIRGAWPTRKSQVAGFPD